MEAAVSQLTTTVFTLLALVLGSYVAITLLVDVGLKSAIPSKEIRNGIIKLLSILAFAVIGLFVLSGK